ncbi:MAG TPA: (d)CMP kinase [Candidatus Kapabacteria bacterium]|jgi:cytidylate kinase|nr:(d)CMP kinase [Candidatus Kapabacteria bacterium]HOV92798.1 (d)CMP kinase [Candidatus Kapabacteria bacterium]
MRKNGIIIAIDGPAGSGKSTTARLVAKALNYIYIDTGAMYRAVTLYWLRSGKKLTETVMERLLPQIEISLREGEAGQIVLLNDEDVTNLLRNPEINQYVSPISAMQSVREKLVTEQRRIGKDGGVVMDGRDIGTVVFPDAELKIFLIASISERARRRLLELELQGISTNYDEIYSAIEKRDQYDSTRALSPLKKAPDAIELDTTNLTIAEQCEIVLNYTKKYIG